MKTENLVERTTERALILARARKLTRAQLRELIAAAIGIAVNETITDIVRALELEPGRLRERLARAILGETERIREQIEAMRIATD